MTVPEIGLTGPRCSRAALPVGCQKSAWPVSCSDGPGPAVGHDDDPCPCACFTSSSSGSSAGWSCSAVQRPPKTPRCSCCGTRSPCCAGPIPGPGSTGPTAQSSPHSSGSCRQSCGGTGSSPPAPSCAGRAPAKRRPPRRRGGRLRKQYDRAGPRAANDACVFAGSCDNRTCEMSSRSGSRQLQQLPLPQLRRHFSRRRARTEPYLRGGLRLSN
jgi:hypothetical protein